MDPAVKRKVGPAQHYAYVKPHTGYNPERFHPVPHLPGGGGPSAEFDGLLPGGTGAASGP
jgi:hypothetical protein